jgi:UDP-2,3-diacylglucosamine hydrolase
VSLNPPTSALSAYLPEGYTPDQPIAVLAGRGDYPKIMVARMRAAGVACRLIAMEGETSDALWDSFPPGDKRMIKVGQIGKLLKYLQDLGCRYNVMVGQIRPGRLFKGLHPDLKAVRILHSLKERNAETLYGAVVGEMKSIGVETLDARVFIDDQMASLGVMTGGKAKVEAEVLAHGIRIANEVARLDIGQGIIVRQGTVLCVEEFDGTDAMLLRSARFQTQDKLFVKTVKPNQDYRIDVPVFGETTLESMKSGGIQIAALAAGRTIMLNKQQVIDRARAMKIQLIGF